MPLSRRVPPQSTHAVISRRGGRTKSAAKRESSLRNLEKRAHGAPSGSAVRYAITHAPVDAGSPSESPCARAA